MASRNIRKFIALAVIFWRLGAFGAMAQDDAGDPLQKSYTDAAKIVEMNHIAARGQAAFLPLKLAPRMGIEMKRNPKNGKTMLFFSGWPEFMKQTWPPVNAPDSSDPFPYIHYAAVSYPLKAGAPFFAFMDDRGAVKYGKSRHALCGITMDGPYFEFHRVFIKVSDTYTTLLPPAEIVRWGNVYRKNYGWSSLKDVPVTETFDHIGQVWRIGVDPEGYIHGLDIMQTSWVARFGVSMAFQRSADETVLSREDMPRQIDLLFRQLQLMLAEWPRNSPLVYSSSSN